MRKRYETGSNYTDRAVTHLWFLPLEFIFVANIDCGGGMI